MGREFELKFRAEEAGFAALRKDFPELKAIEMQTHYYDTPDHTLGRRKWTLRRREENGVSVCTLKTPLPEGGCREWEVTCDNIRLGARYICTMMGSQELWELIHRDLHEVCGAQFTRLCALIPVEGGAVELALDRGRLFGGKKSCDLLEVEVELKAGSDEAALQFAGEIAEKYCLVPEKRSKFARALALAEEKQE